MKKLLLVLPAILLLAAACTNQSVQQNQHIQPSTQTETQINPRSYTLESFDLTQSPIYGQLDAECMVRLQNVNPEGKKDYKIVKNGTVVIPSLKELMYEGVSFKDDCYVSIVEVFSAPADEKYLYLKTYRRLEGDAPYSGLSALYRVDLSSNAIKRLTVTELIANVDLYRGDASDSYQILADGKRVVKWNMNGVYLINLETDSRIALYTAPNNQWLISDVIFGMGQTAWYDVEIKGSEVTIGIYDKTRTQNNEPIKVDKFDNVTVESSTWNREEGVIKPKFITRTTVTIPN